MTTVCQMYPKFMCDLFQNYAKCMSNLSQIYVQLIPNLCQMYVQLIPNLRSTYAKCIPNLSPTYPKFMLNVFQDGRILAKLPIYQVYSKFDSEAYINVCQFDVKRMLKFNPPFIRPMTNLS